MMKIIASKQVGLVSYCVSDLHRLIQVLDSQLIYASKKPELNPKTNKKENYVSLSRNLTAACKRNPTRWAYGVVVDGTKLSNRYHIEPFSYANTNLAEGKNLAIKELTAYDDNTYKLRLVNWPAMDISKAAFDELARLIETQSAEFNESHKLQHTGRGSRRVNGHMIEEKYNYNVKHGGVRLTSENTGNLGINLAKHTVMNETEERIWLKANQRAVDISDCVVGIVMDESTYHKFDDENDPIQVQLVEILDEICPNYKVWTY